MSQDLRFVSTRFPRGSKYHPDWILASASSGANTLWITEWLSSAMDLSPGMRVLDLGCGRAMSSIFLSREFGVQVWATDLWFSTAENLQRIRDAGVEDNVFPIQANARSLPFPKDFFNVIVCIDSMIYFGTDDLYLNDLARYLKPGGQVGISGVGLMREITGAVPEHLRSWWTMDHWCLHSAAWWRRHWERTCIVEIVLADHMPEGWQHWLDWQTSAFPENRIEIETVQADRGSYLGYTRLIARRSAMKLDDPIEFIAAQYTKTLLLRSEAPLV